MENDLIKQEILTQDNASELYEDLRYKNPYSRMWHDWHIKTMLRALNQEKLRSGRILDNGCGVGILAEYLPDADLVGIDISPKMVEFAKSRMKKVVLGTSEKLPFENGYFDAVLCRALLHHLPSPEEAVKEVKRVLKKGGQAVFSDTLSSFVSALPRKIVYRTGHFSELHKNLSRKELVSMLGGYFDIEKAECFGFVAYPLLALPDVANFLKWLPFKKASVPALIGLDRLLMKIPLIKRQAWGIMVSVRKN